MRRMRVRFRAHSLAETIEANRTSVHVWFYCVRRARALQACACCIVWAATRQPAGAIYSAAAGSLTRVQYWHCTEWGKTFGSTPRDMRRCRCGVMIEGSFWIGEATAVASEHNTAHPKPEVTVDESYHTLQICDWMWAHNFLSHIISHEKQVIRATRKSTILY